MNTSEIRKAASVLAAREGIPLEQARAMLTKALGKANRTQNNSARMAAKVRIVGATTSQTGQAYSKSKRENTSHKW